MQVHLLETQTSQLGVRPSSRPPCGTFREIFFTVDLKDSPTDDALKLRVLVRSPKRKQLPNTLARCTNLEFQGEEQLFLREQESLELADEALHLRSVPATLHPRHRSLMHPQ